MSSSRIRWIALIFAALLMTACGGAPPRSFPCGDPGDWTLVSQNVVGSKLCENSSGNWSRNANGTWTYTSVGVDVNCDNTINTYTYAGPSCEVDDSCGVELDYVIEGQNQTGKIEILYSIKAPDQLLPQESGALLATFDLGTPADFTAGTHVSVVQTNTPAGGPVTGVIRFTAPSCTGSVFVRHTDAGSAEIVGLQHIGVPGIGVGTTMPGLATDLSAAVFPTNIEVPVSGCPLDLSYRLDPTVSGFVELYYTGDAPDQISADEQGVLLGSVPVTAGVAQGGTLQVDAPHCWGSLFARVTPVGGSSYIAGLQGIGAAGIGLPLNGVGLSSDLTPASQLATPVP